MKVRIEGLKQLVSALHSVDAKLPNQVKRSGLKVAQLIAAKSRENAANHVGQKGFYGGSGATIRAFYRGFSAFIQGGGASTPYFWAAEFGGRQRSGWYANIRPNGSAGSQWLPWRGNQFQGWAGGPGYMMHPAIRDNADKALEQYENEVERLYREAFPG